MPGVQCAPGRLPGGNAGGATPVPIPNTEVKSSKADDTAIVRWWESRSLPGFYKEPVGFHNPAGSFYLSNGMQVCQGSLAPAPPGATLPGSARRKPSGILSAAILRSQCLSQFQLSFPAEPRRVPRSSGEVRAEPWYTCSYRQGHARWCDRAAHWTYMSATWGKGVRVPLEAVLERNCAKWKSLSG